MRARPAAKQEITCDMSRGPPTLKVVFLQGVRYKLLSPREQDSTADVHHDDLRGGVRIVGLE